VTERRGLAAERGCPSTAAMLVGLLRIRPIEATARLVTVTIGALPGAIRDELFDDLESFLVDQAGKFCPAVLGKIARRLTDTLDPDGTGHDSAHRDRCRYRTVHQRPDGSRNGTFELTAQATEALLTVLDATAAPRPSTDGVKDPRTAGQRRHDGTACSMHCSWCCVPVSCRPATE
jgi:Domain of unknown function (DUF222)